jgi:hypothetical protein
MGAKIFAAVTLIIILGFVIINDLALKNDIDELSRLVEESQTYYEAEAAQDFYEEKKGFIGLSVNHNDLAEVGQLLSEYVAELREGDEGARITKSRLLTALSHLGRLSSVNWESII